MPITRKPSPKSADQFIDGALPAVAEPAAEKRPVGKLEPGKERKLVGRKNQINVGIRPKLLEALDAYADENGLTRPAVIERAIEKFLKLN